MANRTQQLLRHYIIVASICFAFTISCIIFRVHPSSEFQGVSKFERNYKFLFADSSIAVNNQNIKPFADIIYKERLGVYQDSTKELCATLLLIASIVVLGLLVFFYNPKDLSIPVFNIKLPESLIFLFLIFGPLYLWQHFGLVLNSTIDYRLSLMNISEKLVNNDSIPIAYAHQPFQDYIDNALVDNWCSFYFKTYNGVTTKTDPHILHLYEGVGLYGLYGLLFGVLYAICFGAFIELSLRQPKYSGVLLFLLYLSLAFMIVANIAWIGKHNYAVIFTSWYWLVASAALLAWRIKRPVMRRYQTEF